MTPDPIQSLDDAQAVQRAREYLQRAYAYTGLGEVIFGALYVALGVYMYLNFAAVLPNLTYFWIGAMVLRNIVVNRIDESRKAAGRMPDRWPISSAEIPHIKSMNRGATVISWISTALFIAMVAESIPGISQYVLPYWYPILFGFLAVKTVEMLRRVLTTHLWEYGFEVAGIFGAVYCYDALIKGKVGPLYLGGILVSYGAGSLLSGLCLHARWSSWVNELERDEAGKDRHELPGN